MNQTNPAYLANHNKRKCCNEPIRMQPVSSAGRCRATNAKGGKRKQLESKTRLWRPVLLSAGKRVARDMAH